MEWSEESALITSQANYFGVDPLWIETIRKVENGGPGREFGVLSVPAPTYGEQLRVCCATVQARLWNFTRNPFKLQQVSHTHSRLRYTEDFILWFASFWAPLHAKNDPLNLNANWGANAISVYTKLIDNLNLEEAD